MQTMEVASWTNLKTLIESKKLLVQYAEDVTGYDLFAPESFHLLWHVRILKGSSETTDFETNFKANANKPLDVRAAANRPPRVSASPQPDGTTETWKGYLIDVAANDTSKYVDISFAETVHLRGGTIYSADVIAGDKFKAEIQVIANGATVKTPMEDCYMIPNMPIVVISPECMEFANILRLRVTFTPAVTGTAKKVYVLLDYYAS